MHENVNTSIVKALMFLRRITLQELSNLVHVPMRDMHDWLYDIGEASEARVPFQTQLEILQLLGVAGEAPRRDVVHYWRLHEKLFSSSNDTYWALQVLLKAFGKAQVVFLARESDPAFSFNALARFGLRFEGFVAILEVTAHPFRTISFDPNLMPDLEWVPDTFGVLLPDAEYDALEPGAMKVPGMQQYLTYSAEVAQWERLRDAVMEKGLRADQVATLLLGGPLQEVATALPAADEVKTTSAKATVEAVQVVDNSVDDEFAMFSKPVPQVSA